MFAAAKSSRQGSNEMRAGADKKKVATGDVISSESKASNSSAAASSCPSTKSSGDTSTDSTGSTSSGASILSYSRRRKPVATRRRPKSALGSYINPARSTWKPNTNTNTNNNNSDGESEHDDDEHSSIFSGISSVVSGSSSSPSASSNNVERKTSKGGSGIMNGRKRHNKIHKMRNNKKHQEHQQQEQEQEQQQHVGELATKPKGIDEAVAKTLINECDLPRHRAANAATETGSSRRMGLGSVGGGGGGGCIRSLLSPGINNRDLQQHRNHHGQDEQSTRTSNSTTGTSNSNNGNSRSNIGELAVKPVSVPVPKAGTEEFPFGAPQYTFETSHGSSSNSSSNKKKSKFGLFRRSVGGGDRNSNNDGRKGCKMTAQQQSGQPVFFDDPVYGGGSGSSRNNGDQTAGRQAAEADVSIDSSSLASPNTGGTAGNTKTKTKTKATTGTDSSTSTSRPTTTMSPTTTTATGGSNNTVFNAVFPDTASNDKNIKNNEHARESESSTFDADFDSAALGSTSSSSSSSRPPHAAAAVASSSSSSTGGGSNRIPSSAADARSTASSARSVRSAATGTSRSTSRSRSGSGSGSGSTSRLTVADQRRSAQENRLRLQQEQMSRGAAADLAASNTSFFDEPQQQQQQQRQTRSVKHAPIALPRPAKDVSSTSSTWRASSLDTSTGTTPPHIRRSSTNTDSTGPLSLSQTSSAQMTSSGSPKPPPQAVCVVAANEADEDAANNILEMTADSFFDQSPASANTAARPRGPDPSELATTFFARSRSVSPSKRRPPATSSSSSRKSTGRSQSRGRSGGSTTKRSSGRQGRSQSRSRSRRHRSKSRDGGASVSSSLSIDEESQFLDCLADHFPPDVRTRDYKLSKNSAGNARLLIDSQVRKIRQERIATAQSAAAVTERLRQLSHQPRHVHGAGATATRTSLEQRSASRPGVSRPAASSSDHYDKQGSYGSRDGSNPVAASLDAAARALSLSEPFDEGPSGTSSILSSEEAYVRGYERADHQSELHAFPRDDDEEDSFHAIGEIMSNGSSISKQQQQQHTGSTGQSQTPHKNLISKTPSLSPHSVSEW